MAELYAIQWPSSSGIKVSLSLSRLQFLEDEIKSIRRCQNRSMVL